MHILIVQGSPGNAVKPANLQGWRTNEEMFSEALTSIEPSIQTFTLHIADGERLPQGMAVTDFDGAMITGSPLSIYEGTPAVTRQLDLARNLYHAGVPTWGSCWGLQVMSAALGGDVRLNPRGREIGVARSILLNDAGRAHAMFEGRPAAFDALCSHQDEVATLPSGGTVLASNLVSEVQAAEIADGNKSFWGVQYHPEFDFPLIAALIERRSEKHLKDGYARDGAEVAGIVADFRALGAEGEARKDLVWRYGLKPDTLAKTERTREFRRWLDCKVKPYVAVRT